MSAKTILTRVAALLPWLAFTVLLLGLVAVKLLAGYLVPHWVAWWIGAGWALMAFGYAVRFELFKQIGGLFIVLLAGALLAGALMPLDRVESGPRMAAGQLVETFESTWEAVYEGQLFENFSPKQVVSDSLRSLGRIDPLRGGRMFALVLFGFAVAASFLFPYDPPKRRALADARVYLLRLGILLFAVAAFASHLELLQVLTRTRRVMAGTVLENMLGVVVGVLAFLPVQWAYMALAARRAKESPRFNVLGVGVDAVNMADCCALFEEIIQKSGPDTPPAMTSALGVAGIVAARRDPKLQVILNRSVLNTPDGMPLVWLGKLYGYAHIERVYGPDLLRDICAYSAEHTGDTEVPPAADRLPPGGTRGWTHYFYGAAPGIVEKLKAELERKHPAIQIVGIKCPPFRPLTAEEEAELVAEVARVKPDIFWIGISTPKQLYLMDHFRQILDCKILCPVGYAFDVNAGVEIDAPDWIKYAGLQWLHRGIKQPRLWRRYLPDNPRFVAEVVLQILRIRKYRMEGKE